MARTILVVDDEPTLRETLAEALEQDGLRVVTAADGKEALEQFRATDPDLMLLDLMLPKVDGLEILAAMRKAGRSSPVLILTARDAVEDMIGRVADLNRALADEGADVQDARFA